MNKLGLLILIAFIFSTIFSFTYAETGAVKVLTEQEAKEYLKTIDDEFNPKQYDSKGWGEEFKTAISDSQDGSSNVTQIKGGKELIEIMKQNYIDLDLIVKNILINFYKKNYYFPEIKDFLKKHENEIYYSEEIIVSDAKETDGSPFLYRDIEKLKIQYENEKQKSISNINELFSEKNAIKFTLANKKTVSHSESKNPLKKVNPDQLQMFLFSAPKPNQISLSSKTLANNVFLTFLLILFFELIYKINTDVLLDFKEQLEKSSFLKKWEKKILNFKYGLKDRKILRYPIIVCMFILYGSIGLFLNGDFNIDWKIYFIFFVVTTIYSLFEFGLSIYLYNKNKVKKILLQSFSRFLLLFVGLAISKYFSIYPALLIVLPLYLFSITHTNLSTKKEISINVSKISTIFFIGITSWFLSMYLQDIWEQIAILLFTVAIQGLFYSIETSEIFNKNKQKSDFLEKITFFDEKT